MKAGRLDRRIEIQAKSTSRNSFNEATESFATIFTTWAEVHPLRGDERYASSQVIGDADSLFRIRYRKGITTLNRIKYDERVYDIKHVAEIGRREGLQIVAKTRSE